MKTKKFELKHLNHRTKSWLKPWELDWHAFGPIPSSTVNLKEYDQIDGSIEIPSKLSIDGREYQPVICSSTNGILDFKAIFEYDSHNNYPLVFLFAEIFSPVAREIPISFGADWTSIWWLNGKKVYDTSSGNGLPPEDVFGNQFMMPLQQGDNILMIKVGSGVCAWNLKVFSADRLPENKELACAIPSFKKSSTQSPTRDYSRSGLRLENRNGYGVPGSERWELEKIAAKSGVEARWIQVADSQYSHGKKGAPYYQSKFLKSSPETNADTKKRLQSWIKSMQTSGMPVISWFSMSYAYESLQANPDWSSKPFPNEKLKKHLSDLSHVCTNSPYGEALIAFAIEAIGELDFDGFWFDGAYFSPSGWAACSCDYCREKFEKHEGIDFPEKEDWSDPSFRRWVKWRYKAFSEFWGRLAGGIQRAHPHARVVVNHMHRVEGNWLKGCPLNPTNAPVIGGTEASSLEYTSSLHTRLIRSYGYLETENWMGLHGLHGTSGGNPSPYIHHALSCMTAGGMPSFGSDDPIDKNKEAYQALAAIVNPRTRWTGGESIPYVALHVSEQAETFMFSSITERVPYFNYDLTRYWHSILGWNNLLTETQCLTDVIFDDHLKPGILAKYPVLVLPLSSALSDENLSVLEEYLIDGGTLVVGPWFGTGDEWGEKADPKRVKNILGVNASAPPKRGHLEVIENNCRIHKLGAGTVIHLEGDLGINFHRNRSRELALEMSDLIKEFAKPPIALIDNDPNIHLGLYRQAGSLVLHIHNAIGYSSSLASFPNPLMRAPVLKENIQIDINGFPVRKVKIVAGESTGKPVFERDQMTTKIILPELNWGAVLELEI